jgi:putative aldouronate transport system substrate-binding protein
MKGSRSYRILSVLLVALIVFSISACQTNPPTSTPIPTTVASPTPVPLKYDPPITISVARSLSEIVQKAIAAKSDVLDDNIWTRAYKDELGINITNLWSVPVSQYEAKLNVAISANDLPDIIECNARQFKLLVDSGVATDLTKAFADYASDFTKEMMKADNNVGLSQATVDGKLMALPLLSGNIDPCPILWIRADWLKAVGLEAPKTMDDVMKIADAVVKQDPDKNGKDDTQGLGLYKDLFDGGFASLDGFFEGFHAYPNGWLEASDGTLVFSGIQPEVKNALAMLATMYKNGLIDKEFVVKDGAKISEGTTNGTIGMLYGQHWLPFWPFEDCKKKNPESDWQAYPMPSVDSTPAKAMLHGSATTFFVVKNGMKNPEAAVKLYNFQYAKDTAMSPDYDVKFHGIASELETIPDQNWEFSVVRSFFPTQNLYIYQQAKKYYQTKDSTILDLFWIKDNVDQHQKYLAGDISFWMTYRWSGPDNSAFQIIEGYVQNQQTLVNAYIKADTTSMTDKGTTLRQLRLETFTKIIMGTVPIDEFDNYVASWKSLGGNDITAEVNAVK